jgi:hypothetical protein
MAMRILSPKGVENMLRFAREQTPPPTEITQLKEEIENRTNAAEVKASVTGEIDQDEIDYIVALKLRLDALYGMWCEGEL